MLKQKNYKRIKFYTLGCKVNQYETQGIREQLSHLGFRENDSRQQDVIIINTCAVTQRADAESCRLIRKSIESNPKAKVIVTGCLVDDDSEKILQICDRIQLIPNYQKHNILTSLLKPKTENRTPTPRLRGTGKPKTETDNFSLTISDFKNHQRAFVKVQDGCNNFCSYCKVPLVRGRSRSRKPKEIVMEVEHLTNNGFKEVVLSGICLGDYRYKDFNLINLLAKLEKIDGEFRIRLSSIEPQLIDEDLIGKIADSDKICPYLHIPLQSGDNGILKLMNRRYTIKDYLSLIAKIKKKIKDVGITTDVLAGFPGEKERNFRNTVVSLKEILPLRMHIFSFSPRRGTTAFKMRPYIEPRLIKERVNLLREVAAECSYKFRRHFLKRQITVLIESKPLKGNDSFCGYSENYIRITVENASKKDVNNLALVKVKAVDIHSTKGHYLFPA